MGLVLALYVEWTRAGAFVGQALALLLHVQLSQWHGDLHEEPFWVIPRDLLMLPQEHSKGRAPQVTFPAQVRVKIRDRVRVRVQGRVRLLSAGAS